MNNLITSVPLKLSDYFPAGQIQQDGHFTQLDECLTRIAGSLVFCQTAEYLDQALANPHVAAVMTTPQLAKRVGGLPCVILDNPYQAFFQLYEALFDVASAWPAFQPGRGRNCVIHPSASVSPNSFLGDGVTLGPHVVIGDYVSIGAGTFLDAGVVIGAEGMMPLKVGNHRTRVRHRGGVIVGTNVVVLSNSVVSRSVYQTPTQIEDETHIGILTNIGHGVQVGKCCLIRGNCILAGRVIIEEGATIDASVSIRECCRVGAKAEVKMGSVVVKDVPAGATVSGNFAYSHRRHVAEFLRNSK